jgi:hypothetical protein
VVPGVVPCPEEDPEPPSIEEQEARDLLVQLMEGCQLIRPRPPGHPTPPTADFVICRGGEVVGGLEVSSSRDGKWMATLRELGAEDFTVDAEGDRSWVIALDRTVKLRALKGDRGKRTLLDLVAPPSRRSATTWWATTCPRKPGGSGYGRPGGTRTPSRPGLPASWSSRASPRPTT